MAKRANEENLGVEIAERLFELIPDSEAIWGPRAKSNGAGDGGDGGTGEKLEVQTELRKIVGDNYSKIF